MEIQKTALQEEAECPAKAGRVAGKPKDGNF
jgi:hypothetical protein